MLYLFLKNGLKTNFLHEETTIGVGRLIGELHRESLRRCVVGQRYIQIRVDIAVDLHFQPGFFKREDGEDAWVQFKYGRILDFCYKCGALGHVIGRCIFEKPATFTSGNGIVAKLYGP